MIELINVKKQYKERVLFENVNLKIDRPGIYTFIGDNGIGKTTLLNIINKSTKINEGKVLNQHKNISFVSQKINLIEHLTVKEHLDIYDIKYNVLRKFKIFSKLNNYPKELSLGQRQRVAFIIGLYSASTLLLLDEPTSNLDKENSSIFYQELRKISKFKTVLLVTHDLKRAYEYSDCIYKIENEKISEVLVKPMKNKGFFKKSTKLSFKKYINMSIRRNTKSNVIYVFITFIFMFLILLTNGISHVFNKLIQDEISYSLDYNKFYLKECDEISKDGILMKKCQNLSEEKIDKLKEYKVNLNLDLFVNSIYNSDKFNFVDNDKALLKEGNYPSKYNEIITNENYQIGDIIKLKTSKIITGERTDIYSKTLILKVVGITENRRFFKENSYYLDYQLFSDYLKKEMLINNKMDLYSYFKWLDIDNYKYVIYFDDIDLDLLKKLNISYLSSSYDYYDSMLMLNEEIKTFFALINYLFIPVGLYYFIKTIKKKLKMKDKEVLFLKANMVNKKRIIKLISKENCLLILFAFCLAFLFVNIGIYLIFYKLFINMICFFIPTLLMGVNHYLVRNNVNRQVNI